MDFTKEIIDFPSQVHAVIYHSAREATTLDRSLVEITDKNLRFSCEEYYAYLMELFADMYERPLSYAMPLMEIENFLGGKKLNGVKRKFPSKTKSLVAKTRNCVDRYLQTLCKMACVGTLDGNALILSKDQLATIDKEVNTSASPLSLAKRLEALSLTGLIFEQCEKDCSKVAFYSSRHPKMFPAMVALAKKTGGSSSGFNYYFFSKTDFRNIYRDYRPTPNDYFAPLLEERRNICLPIHDIALKLGCKTDISTFLKVNYKYKGAQVMLIDTKEGNLEIRITEVYSWDNQSVFNDLLDKQTEQMRKYADRHLWRCTACSTSHLGQMIEFLGKRNRVCGGGQIGFVWLNPTMADEEMIQYFLTTRCKIIDELKKT